MREKKSVLKKMLATALLFLLFFLPLLQGDAEAAEKSGKMGWHGPFEWIPHRAGDNEACYNQKVIKRYDDTNVDEIKALIPLSLYDIMKDPSKYGEFHINLTPPRKYPGPKEYAEATEKYKGTCEVDQQGILRNWWSGCPFPEPKSGWEIIWNFEKKPLGDDYEAPSLAVITDRKGHVHHSNVANWYRYWYVGRTKLAPLPDANDDPKPFFTDGDDGMELIDSFGYSDPYDLRGLIPRYTRYKDPFKKDDMWMYIPAMRRVRRMSTAQRMDSIGGGNDATWDDFLVFSGKVMDYNWELIGKEEMIIPRFCKPKAEWIPGHLLSGTDDYYQKMEGYVVECRPKDPNHVYSKKVIYVDPEGWTLPYGMFFDSQGKFWKHFAFHYSYDKNWVQYPGAMTLLDVQRDHSTVLGLFDGNANQGRTPDDMTLDALKRKYPGR